jgi:hypothetical protein
VDGVVHAYLTEVTASRRVIVSSPDASGPSAAWVLRPGLIRRGPAPAYSPRRDLINI